MPESQQNRPDVQAHLDQVLALLHRYELVENLVHLQETPRIEGVTTHKRLKLSPPLPCCLSGN